MRPFPLYGVLSLAIVGLCLIGCGGSSSSGPASNGNGAPQQARIGGMTVNYTSQKPLQSVSSTVGPAVVTGLGGGSFSNISFEPVNNLNETNLAFSEAGEVGSYSFLTNTKKILTSLTPLSDMSTSPSFSHDGRIVFYGINAGKPTLMTMLADGSGIQAIPTVGTFPHPAFAPTNNLIAYTSGGLLRIAQTSGSISATGTTTYGGTQEFAVAATGGTYQLKFAGQTTSSLAYNASAAQVQAALNALSSVTGANAGVTVVQESASQPLEYLLFFTGNYRDQNVSAITANTTGLSGSITFYLPRITAGLRPAWSFDGSKIAVSAALDDQFGIDDTNGIAIYKSNGALQSYYSFGGGVSVGSVAWSPDGTKFAAVSSTGTNWNLVGMDAVTTSIWTIHDSSTDSVGSDADPTFSPDGKTIAFVRASNPSSVWTVGVGGTEPTQLFTASSNINDVDWQYYPSKKTYIGTGGTLGTAASGFLFGQGPAGFGSLVVCSATTPSSVTISPQSIAGSAFIVKADSITGLSFTNAYYGANVNVIPSQTGSSSQALVMFNMNDGTVSGVATIAPKAPPISSVKLANSVVYTGEFQQVWDAKGKLLSSGATKIEADSMKPSIRAR